MLKLTHPMKKNAGTVDAVIRVILGLGLIAYGIANQIWIGALGTIPLLTAFVGFCPVYCPLGLSIRGKGGGCSGGSCGG